MLGPSRSGLMFQFPLVEQDKTTGLAMTSRVGEFIARNPRLEIWRTEKFSYVVGNQSGWVGKPTKLLSIHLIYPLDPKP